MKKLIALIGMLMICWALVQLPITDTYLISLATNNQSTLVNNEPLYNEITEKAKDYEKKPVNARIDPVWKAIPGINGLQVDVEASYKNMKEEGKFDEKKLVYKQLIPSVVLSDLPPAPIYKGNPDKEMVSFLINVAWGNEYLPEIIAILEKYHVKASFFLEGRWVQKNPELAKMIVEAGHEVGNHSYTHPDMSKISSSKIREEIIKTNEVIKATTGKTVIWLAPPSGSYTDEVVKIASEQRLGTLMWSVDTIDWQKPSPEVLQQRVLGKLHNGAMILMHPTEATTKSLERLILEIQNKGLDIDTVSDMLSEERNLTSSNK